MRLLSLLVAALFLCVSYGNAEINMVNVVRKPDGMSFRVSYNAESQTYWVMTHVVKQLFGVTVGHWYRVYQISEDMTDISLAFRTSHAIYDMVATPEGVFYTREIVLVPTSVDIYYYDARNNSNKRAAPRGEITTLYGEVDGSPLYAQRDVGLCMYDATSNAETVLIKGIHNVLWDNTYMLYKNNSGSKFAYLLETGEVVSVEYPENITQISNGYMLDAKNALLYTPEHTVVSVPFIEGAQTVALREGFLCSQRLASDGNSRVLSYISLDNPEEIIRVDIPLLIDQNIHIVNGNVFLYTRNGTELVLVIVDLSSGTTKTIVLP